MRVSFQFYIFLCFFVSFSNFRSMDRAASVNDVSKGKFSKQCHRSNYYLSQWDNICDE